jgi:hypothetical protein
MSSKALRRVVAAACALALTALLVFAAAAPGVAPVRAQVATPTPTTDPSEAEDPEIKLSAASNSAFAGGTIRYTITVRNPSNIRLKSVVVKLPFDPSLIRPIGSEFSKENDWVSALSSSEMTVRFSGFGRDSRRSATLIFAVADHLAPGTVISVRGRYEWDRERADVANRPNVERDGDGRTRTVDVQVIAPNTPPEIVVVPPGGAGGASGDTLVFFANQFLPKEPIAVWVNAPAGIIPVNAAYETNERGEVSFTYSTTGLATGDYGMVIYGRSSGQTVVVPFRVRDGAPPVIAPVGGAPPEQPQPHPVLVPVGDRPTK